MLREGSGEPLVLYHGILGSERVWSHVVPLLATDHDAIAMTALGHRGGPAPTSHPTTIDDVIDEAERQLDELGLERAHLAGNSMGGWIALELARRGRASSVCALSPAGFWEEDWAERDRTFELLLTARREARRGRGLIPLLSRSSRFRHWAMRDACLHGERLTRAEFLDVSADTDGCDVAEEMIGPGFQLEAMEASCPITIAWAAEDRLFPLPVYRERGEHLVSGARFIVLDGVGHVPMFDDPHLVADTIRAAARASASASSPGP
jgi:pimeloyl-ACP methyl ester carboxylesterase